MAAGLLSCRNRGRKPQLTRQSGVRAATGSLEIYCSGLEGCLFGITDLLCSRTEMDPCSHPHGPHRPHTHTHTHSHSCLSAPQRGASEGSPGPSACHTEPSTVYPHSSKQPLLQKEQGCKGLITENQSPNPPTPKIRMTDFECLGCEVRCFDIVKSEKQGKAHSHFHTARGGKALLGYLPPSHSNFLSF